MVPKYPFIVRKFHRHGAVQEAIQDKSFETLTAATRYAELISSSPMVRRVQVLAILDEICPSFHNNSH